LYKQIGILTVTYNAPAGCEDLLNLIGPKKRVGSIAGYAVDGRSERVEWAKCVDDMTRRRVDNHGLGQSLWGEADQRRCNGNAEQNGFQAFLAIHGFVFHGSALSLVINFKRQRQRHDFCFGYLAIAMMRVLDFV
jgi:hypothetical protein